MHGGSLSREIIEAHVDRLLASVQFRRSARLQRFVRLTVGWTLDGRAGELRERSLAVSVYGRDPDYDSRSDSIVRSEAHRLRAKLRDYYRSDGAGEALCIDYPEGSYVPVFRERDGVDIVSREAYQAAHFSAIDYANTWVGGLDRVAEGRLRRVLEREPEHPDALADLAYLQLLRLYPPQEDPGLLLARARALLERALARDPAHARGLSMLGEVEGALGRREASLEASQRAVSLAPESAFVWSSLGLRCLGLGYYESSLVAYERAIELEGAWEHALEGRAWTLAKLGRYAEGERCAARFRERVPLGPRPDYAAGVVRIAAGDLDGAEAALRDGLGRTGAADTSHLEIGLGLVAALRGDVAAARAVLARHAGSPPRTHDHLVRLCLLLGEGELALRHVRGTPYLRNHRFLATELPAEVLARPGWRELREELRAEWRSELARLGPRLLVPPPEVP